MSFIEEGSPRHTRSGLPEWAYAYGKPSITGQFKSQLEDFIVIENLAIDFSNQGEHIWVKVRKRKQNTEQVAKALARFANVSYRDVAYSGLKDYFAQTTQWFSIHRPGNTDLDMQLFDCAGVEILETQLHSRKLKRGSHKTNYFEIVVRDLDGDASDLDQRLNRIKTSGVPNYFGEQRFGRHGENISQAEQMFSTDQKINTRSLRSILISAARSFLFNELLSSRIIEQTWQSFSVGEPVCLDGSNSYFSATENQNDDNRLKDLDIHPSCALWGMGDSEAKNQYPELYEKELEIINKSPQFKRGLEEMGLKLERRASRMKVNNLIWRIEDRALHLKFELTKGQFATSVLREVCRLR